MVTGTLAIRLDDIDKHGTLLEVPLSNEYLAPLLFEEVYRPRTPGRVRVFVKKHRNAVVAICDLDATVSIICCRCCSERERAIALHFEQTYYPLPEDRVGTTTEDDDSGDDLDRFYYTGDRLDFERGVREHFVFALDPHPVCGANERCTPIDTTAPADEEPELAAPVDPRWAKLMTVKLADG
ncbi:MAG: DUF177 domain-containing protein [Myxococcales bacterium]|nr:DUF177 domain-containing protein [Myxococcales bacterium]